MPTTLMKHEVYVFDHFHSHNIFVCYILIIVKYVFKRIIITIISLVLQNTLHILAVRVVRFE